MLRFFLLLQMGLLGLGLVWMGAAGYPFLRGPDPWRDTLAFGLLFLALAGLERLFSRLFPQSFKAAEALHGQLARVLRTEGIRHPQALLLALASGLGEEVFFRGAVQNALYGGWLGVVLQALVFTAFHPVPDRRAWSYSLFVFCGGLLFGAAYLLTGSLLPGILAHYLHNAKGFYELLDRPPGGSLA